MKVKKCEICSIVFREKDETIGGIQVKAGIHNKQSEVNIKRCVFCEDAESRIEYYCYCGNPIYNNLKRFIICGNTCTRCIDKVHYIIKLKKNVSDYIKKKEFIDDELDCRDCKRDSKNKNLKELSMIELLRMQSELIEMIKEEQSKVDYIYSLKS